MPDIFRMTKFGYDKTINEKEQRIYQMLYTIPDYYKEFACIADKCEDTCCAGWQIVIDKKSLNKYKCLSSKYGKTVRKKVNWFTGTFKQDKDKRCAFLNHCNLCELYLHEGDGIFCKTCHLYPRHIEEFEGVREISLSISCPEVARILMNKTDKVEYLTYEKEGEEEYGDFDPFLFSMLEDARKEMLSILQNRDLPIGVRVVLVLGMAHDIQGRINRQELFDCFSVMEKYKTKKAEQFAEKFYSKNRGFTKHYHFVREQFDKLYRLELLKEDWDALLLESEVLLYSKGADGYRDAVIAFERDKQFASEVAIQLEQLLVYFIFTYMPGAVYDGELYSKVQMSVYCVLMIYELWIARFVKNEGCLSMEERIDLVYRFSREVEHSDKNRNKVEEMVKRPWK